MIRVELGIMNDQASKKGDLVALITIAQAPRLGDSHVILQPFREQNFTIGWIFAVGLNLRDHRELTEFGDSAVLVRLGADRNADTEIVARIQIQGSDLESSQKPIYSFDAIARKAREHIQGSAGELIVLLTQNKLRDSLAQISDKFRAVCVLLSNDPAQAREVWKLQRDLFDIGFIGIGSLQVAEGEVRCFLMSECIRNVQDLGAGSRGYVSMTSLGTTGLFANQMFQYLYVKFYALRHCLTAAFPPWQGNHVFDLEDTSCAGLHLPELSFSPFTEDDLVLWQMAEPPINVDLRGYFQEIPACWQKHRSLVRRMFQVSAEYRRLIDDWRDEVTLAGKRTLIAVHVRRGDYRNWDLQSWKTPYFTLISVDWYITWLTAIWPTVDSPILYVATDEPETILPLFQRFEAITCGPSLQAIPSHIRDFEIMRRADYLAICNSSFSHMAAILAPSTQKCFCASLQRRGFTSYEPWPDRHFWRRFSTWRSRSRRWLLSVLPWLSTAK